MRFLMARSRVTSLPRSGLCLDFSAEIANPLPQFLPRYARWTTDEDIGMVDTLFVAYEIGVAIMPGETAVREQLVCAFAAVAQQDDGGGRRRWIPAIPE